MFIPVANSVWFSTMLLLPFSTVELYIPLQVATNMSPVMFTSLLLSSDLMMTSRSIDSLLYKSLLPISSISYGSCVGVVFWSTVSSVST